MVSDTAVRIAQPVFAHMTNLERSKAL